MGSGAEVVEGTGVTVSLIECESRRDAMAIITRARGRQLIRAAGTRETPGAGTGGPTISSRSSADPERDSNHVVAVVQILPG